MKKVIRLDSRKSYHSSRSESPPLVTEKEYNLDETNSNGVINQDESFIASRKPETTIKLTNETKNVNRSPLTKESYLYFMDIRQMHIRKKEENRLILRKENFIKKNKLISSSNHKNKYENPNEKREQNDKIELTDKTGYMKTRHEENDKKESTERKSPYKNESNHLRSEFENLRQRSNFKTERLDPENELASKPSNPKKEEEIILKNMNLKKDEEAMQRIKRLKFQKKETKVFTQNNEPLTPKEIAFNKKYVSYKNFVACIGLTNYIKKIEKFVPPFKYFIGKGNNSSLILSIMKSK